jgi:alpha-1,3-fucosyltransferase
MTQYEPPTSQSFHLKNFNNLINWTMTYRKDSDVFSPYGRRLRLSTPSSSQIALMQSNKVVPLRKKKLVAWTVSHCETQGRREDIVRAMQNYIPVDIYGSCGNLTCSSDIRMRNRRVHVDRGCFLHIEKHYKFYLSFENSLCSEYVTEKLFGALRHNAVPVVYGFANYTSIAPPGSFIDARSFKSIKDLTQYLLKLDGNDTEYLRYFEWRRDYEVKVAVGVGSSESSAWCNLCMKIAQRKNPGKGIARQVYSDMVRWWFWKGPKSGFLKTFDESVGSGNEKARKGQDGFEEFPIGTRACIPPHSYSDFDFRYGF